MLRTLIAQIASGPVLVALDQKPVFEACLASMMADPRSKELAISREIAASSDDDDDDFWPSPEDGDSFLAWLRPYNVTNGILQIPVMGVLLNRFPYAFGSYATGYHYIKKAFDRGMADENVKGIAFIEDSPGGMVAGCFELVDHMSETKTKPVKAFAADAAYSAAYAIAVSADSISVTRSGGVGSVGVVTSHVSFEENLAKNGVKVTFIHAGKYKVEGNPYQDLSPEAQARIQARIDKLYGVFTSTVARERGMSEEDVRKTEALCYDAEDALAVGFADKIESAEDGLADYAALLTMEEDDEMAVQGQDTGKKFGDDDMATAANAARAEGVTEGKATGATEGAAAERARISAILTCPNAVGREAAAIELALDEDTAFSAVSADKILGKMPKAEGAAPVNKPGEHFQAGMEQTAGEPVGQGGEEEAATEGETGASTLGGAADPAVVARITGNYRAVKGEPAKKKAAG